MRDLMDWNRCKEDFIREIEVDKEKIDSIMEIAELRLKLFKKIPIDKDSVPFIVESYYEIIKELLTALLLSQGLRSKNHQCLISYFYHKYPDYEAEAHLIHQMSYLRNRLNYYGESIELDFYEKNKLEFESIIKILKGLIKGESKKG